MPLSHSQSDMTFQISSPCNIPNAFQELSFKEPEDYSDSRMLDSDLVLVYLSVSAQLQPRHMSIWLFQLSKVSDDNMQYKLQ